MLKRFKKNTKQSENPPFGGFLISKNAHLKPENLCISLFRICFVDTQKKQCYNIGRNYAKELLTEYLLHQHCIKILQLKKPI